MGMKLFSSSSFETRVGLPNPDPKRFRVTDSTVIGRLLIVKVVYPDCTNYEGQKILVFDGVELEDLILQGAIDPHFSDNPNMESPIARFVPTLNGWDMAVKLATAISKDES